MTIQKRNRFLSALSVLRSYLFSKEISCGNLIIKGSKEFQDQISSALMLLKERTPEMFDVLNNSLTLIIEGHETVLTFDKGGCALCLAEKHVDASQTWLAGLLAYHGARCELFLKNIKKYGSENRIPKELYSGQKVWDIHYEYLQRLGAEYEQLKHLADFIETRQ